MRPAVLRLVAPLLALAALVLAPPPAAHAQTPGARGDGADAAVAPDLPPSVSFAEAMAAGDKKILVEIYATWCPYCQRMQREVYSDPTVKAYLRAHFAYVRLEGDAEGGQHAYQGGTLTTKQLAQALGLRGFPTTAFLLPDGQQITFLPGFVDAPTFLTVMRYIATDAYQEQSFEAFMTSDEEAASGEAASG